MAPPFRNTRYLLEFLIPERAHLPDRLAISFWSPQQRLAEGAVPSEKGLREEGIGSQGKEPPNCLNRRQEACDLFGPKRKESEQWSISLARPWLEGEDFPRSIMYQGLAGELPETHCSLLGFPFLICKLSWLTLGGLYQPFQLGNSGPLRERERRGGISTHPRGVVVPGSL